MRCGPGTVLFADHDARHLSCARCGIQRALPGLPLFVVTGASGTGKSTITGPLRQRLPDCEVFEADTTLHIAALGWDTWRNTWLQLADAIALNGRVTVLTGSLIPAQLQDLPARRLLGPVHFASLDCPAGMLAERLRARPAWRGTSSEAKIAEHQQFAAWLRANIQPTFDTGVHTADDVATQVAAWVTALLSGPNQSTSRQR